MSHYPSYSKSSFKKYEANQTYLSKKRTDRDSDNSKNKYDSEHSDATAKYQKNQCSDRQIGTYVPI